MIYRACRPQGSRLLVGAKPEYGNAGIHVNATLVLWFQQTARPDNERQEDVIITVADESGIVHLPQNYGTYLGWTNRFYKTVAMLPAGVPNSLEQTDAQ
jgi:hypothetical protein